MNKLAIGRRTWLVAWLVLLVGCAPARPSLRLAFVGDVMLGRDVADWLDGDWESALSGVGPELQGADLACANLESPLTDLPQIAQGYDLRASPDAVTALAAAGLDVATVANNHALDAGQAGLDETRAALERAGIATAADGEVSHPLEGVTLLAYDASINPMDVEAAAEAVSQAAGRGDVVIVSLHWGAEFHAAPGERQREIAARLAGAGADVIVGHGPHVLQAVEWVDGTLVAYSLGNFLFDEPYPLDASQGAILRVTVERGVVTSVEAIPTVSVRGCVRLADPANAADVCRRLGVEVCAAR
jgi:poly-gamma-glutamate capsule biosynthesis protein CapA/YwtB (metallophosphatase superfamily)